MVHVRLSDGFAPMIAAIIVVAIAAAALTQGGSAGVGKGSVVFGRPDIECVSGDFRCRNDILQYCRQGTWTNQEICENGCRNNACIAGTSCTEESYRCLGDYTQACVSGSWVNQERCPAGCGQGKCLTGDQCRSGEYRCLNEYMQSCVYGVWFNKARCREGCKEDACVELIRERTCTDKDDGKDIAKASLVYGVDYHGDYYSKADSCESDRDLVEYYCKDGYALKDGYLCPGECRDGACVELEAEEGEEAPEGAVENASEEIVIVEEAKEEEAPLPAPEPVIAMPETEGFFSRLWKWFKGIFSAQR